MTRTVTEQPATARPRCLETLAAELECVEAELRRGLDASVPLIQDMIRAAGLGEGKLLRPVLLLMAARAHGPVTSHHILMAAVIEMIHAATLVHDDILDGAQVRRHRPAVHRQWGTHQGVLFGDYLFTQAFYLASTSGDAVACQAIGQATNAVCQGELHQTELAGHYDMDLATYFQVIEQKTSALCACATRLGAHFAGCDADRCATWSRVGLRLGSAFQIVDDLLDVQGSHQRCGKTLGTDLQNAKPTLPVLLALRQSSEADRQRWLERLQARRVTSSELHAWLKETGALEMARDQAEGQVRQALDELRDYDAEVREAFQEIGQFLLCRNR